MNFKDYIQKLSDDELRCYATKAGTSVKYIKIQLIPRKRVPRPDLMKSLAVSSELEVTPIDILCHFYPDMFESLPRENSLSQTTQSSHRAVARFETVAE